MYVSPDDWTGAGSLALAVMSAYGLLTAWRLVVSLVRGL